MAPASYPRYTDGPLVQRQHFRDITMDRIGMLEGQLGSVLYEYSSGDSDEAVKMEVWSPGPYPLKPAFKEAKRAAYKPLKRGHQFGPSWTNHWVRLRVSVPKEHRGKDRVTLEFDPSCEALVFDNEGLPLQGLTGGYDGNRRVDFTLSERAQNSPTTFYIEVTCNEMFGNQTGNGPQDPNRYYTLARAEIVVHRRDGWGLFWDYQVIRDLARTLPSDSALGNKALGVANELCNIFKTGDVSSIAKARTEAERVLGKGWRDKGADLYKDDNTAKGTQCEVWAISNCHIDTAWLWPFTCTQQKIARSWSSQVDLMNRYPEHRFACSQAQQFKWLEQLYPQLYDVVKEKIDDGAFQPIGGTWVEMDTNMPSGEAICRQFVYGQRYFKSRFGKYCETFWLPDTFGYSSQLPQLCRLAGMKYFFTQKLSWSQFNDFPHSTFNWIGIDGSQVITHMTPVDTYTAQANVGDVNKAITNHKSLEQDGKSLLPFGNGDGGGGATAPMLEHLRRIRATADGHRDIARPSMGKSVDDFFAAIERDSQSGTRLASWQGELYLELHRGTYTSHGSIKRHNRKSEILMRDLEYFAALASIHARSPSASEASRLYRYPKDELDALWEDVLLCQFHDVLPGSAIGLVYEDAEKIYAKVAARGEALLEEAFVALLPSSENAKCPDRLFSGQMELVCLTGPGMPQEKLVQLKSSRLVLEGQLTVQRSAQEEAHWLYLDGRNGWLEAGIEVRVTRHQSSYIISNALLSATVTSTGRITSLRDIKRNRELILPGRSAGFVIYDDRPHAWDAWDVDIYHLEMPEHLEATTVEVYESGPLRASLKIVFQVGQSTIQTILSVDAVSPSTQGDALSLLRFDNKVDWHERHRFLKFEAPIDIRADTAIYETQFGTINRPTHRNTTWDRAKFEVCGHRFADLCEYGYGVALLNDCKYGYAVEGQTMRLSLLRGPTYPDAEQDQGEHNFSFALYPHASHFMHSDVPMVARVFNAPMHVRYRPVGKQKEQEEALALAQNPIRIIGAPNVMIEAFKRSDDDDFSERGHITSPLTLILRLAEVYGGSASATFNSDLPVQSASLVDLLERDVSTLEISTLDSGSKSISLHFKPFQVLSLKLTLGSTDDYELISVHSDE